MLDQLKELLEMQRVLDDAILKEHGKVYDKTIAEQNKIALFVELGEMMNEIEPLFKHWKKKPKFNRKNALIEYVDALHFALSLFNYYDSKSDTSLDYNECIDEESSIFDTLINITKWYSWADFENYRDCISVGLPLSYLFELGNKLGFTWEEIYNAYKAKNAVNYERLRNGY